MNTPCKGTETSDSVPKQLPSIARVLQHYSLIEAMQRTGNRYVGPCPFDINSLCPEFQVDLATNTFKCCAKREVHGNVVDFVSLREKISASAARDLLIKLLGRQ